MPILNKNQRVLFPLLAGLATLTSFVVGPILLGQTTAIAEAQPHEPQPTASATAESGSANADDVASPTSAAAQTRYSPPAGWDQAKGNPAKGENEAQWRAERVWPDDPANREAYVTMPWRDGAWKAKEHEHGGQPRIAVDHGVVLLSARSAGSSSKGLKIPALVFTVPEAGWYGMKGEASANQWEGYGKLRLRLVRRTSERVDTAHEWSLKDGQKQQLGDVAVKAEKGDELALMLIAHRAGVDVRLRGLAFGQGLVDKQARASKAALEALPRAEVIAEPSVQQIAAANAAVLEAGVDKGDHVYPVAANVRNVKAFGAVGDGKHDDTAAIQAALSGGRLIYVPDGTYLITHTLRWTGRQTRTVLEGQSEAGTVIKLMDHAPGFSDPDKPQAMVWTGKAPAQRFRNAVRNLTLDTGHKNPGATALQFMANNQGGVFNVTLRSSDPRKVGVIGLDLGYSNEQGPCLIKHVTVEGFDTGIRTKHAVDSVTLEHITLRDQNKVGFDNDGQCISLRDLHSDNAVPAYINRQGASLTAIIDSELLGKGQASDYPAIRNDSGMFARNIKTTGYARAIQNDVASDSASGKGVPGDNVDQFVSHQVLTLFPGTPTQSLRLPIKETPTVPWGPLEGWANVNDFKPEKLRIRRNDNQLVKLTDYGPALQRAIDSGAHTVYFPSGKHYGIFSKVVVRGNVRRITGLENEFVNNHGADVTGEIAVADGQGPVVIERMDATYSPLQFRQSGNRPMVLGSISRNEFGRVSKDAGSDDLFIDDMDMGKLQIDGGNVFARQLNLEGERIQTKIDNQGGNLWVLGYKTEGDSLLLNNRDGARTEIVGGFIYANKANDPEKVMFKTDATSALSFTIGEWVIRDQPFDPVEQTRDGHTKRLNHGDAPDRGEGSMVPLFVATPDHRSSSQ